MNVADLLAEEDLHLRLHTARQGAQLAREIESRVATELIDPTPYLSPNCLLLMAGIGFNFHDERTWDAYVERLAVVPVAAVVFGTGSVHRTLPSGLVTACQRHGLPLLELPAMVHLLQVDRHVDGMLQAERMRAVDRGWSLADECARLAGLGADLPTVLAAVYGAISAPVAVYDSYGTVIAQHPHASSWPTAPRAADGITAIPLPMGLDNACLLAVKESRPSPTLPTLLGPVASIIALHLRPAALTGSHEREVAHLVVQCGNWQDATRADISRAMTAAGLDRQLETTVLIADMRAELQATSWQLRMALHDCFDTVCLGEREERLYAFGQRPRMDFESVAARLLGIHRQQPLVLKQPVIDVEELRLALVHMQDLVRHVDGPVLAADLGLSAVVTATAGRGARRAAERFLAPVLAHDAERNGMLLPTLRAYVRCDGQPGRACDELFIHRNTLAYRLRRIESLLGVDMSTLETLATCLLALRLVEIEPY